MSLLRRSSWWVVWESLLIRFWKLSFRAVLRVVSSISLKRRCRVALVALVFWASSSSSVRVCGRWGWVFCQWVSLSFWRMGSKSNRSL